ncbi:hypothetical protein EBR96_09910, partial [bacterium]|nr:hypothetical protein [bacterium]
MDNPPAIDSPPTEDTEDVDSASTSLSISSDTSLIYTQYSNNPITSYTANATPGSSLLPTVGVLGDASAAPTNGTGVDLTSLTSGSGLSAGAAQSTITDATEAPSSALPVHNSTESFTANISVTALGAMTDSTCSVASPYNALSCLMSGFTLLASNIVSDGLSISSGSATSNSIPSTKWILKKVTSINSVAAGTIDKMTVVGSRMYFTAQTAASHYKVHSVDGTASSTTGLVQNSECINSGNDGPSNLRAFNSRLYYYCTTSVGTKLFSTDGVSNRQETNLNPGRSDFIGGLTVAPTQGRLYFFAKPEVAGATGFQRLYSTDGTDLKVHTLGTAFNDIDVVGEANGQLYFLSRDSWNDPGRLSNKAVFSTNGTTNLRHSTISTGGSTDDIAGVWALRATSIGTFFVLQNSAGTGRKVYWTDGSTYRKIT